ncbi:mavicyanin-like [Zingiber officinale]|uniref:mavicyanin-like n=1 Tax=Zingiber officinale TaxID=94328 RepID=UPI001C4D962A|nr:mavicyanin-like [Zingiber officinale]
MERKPTAAAAMAVVGVLLAVSVVPSDGAVLTVGDALGWTIMGSPNYTAWATSKTFHVGDTIVFSYAKSFHNVVEVNKTNYNACNSSSPIATYATGNDSITIKHKGHYYFICGFPGHCDAGQRVDIKVSKLSSPSPSPSPTASSTSLPGSPTTSASSGISPTATNSGTKAVPTVLAAIIAVFCFAATSGGFVRQE